MNNTPHKYERVYGSTEQQNYNSPSKYEIIEPQPRNNLPRSESYELIENKDVKSDPKEKIYSQQKLSNKTTGDGPKQRIKDYIESRNTNIYTTDITSDSLDR